MVARGEWHQWYPFGERDNPTLKPRIIDGRQFFRGTVTTIKAEAEKSAEGVRKRGHFARIIPLVLWGKRRGYELPEKKRCYVVYHSYSEAKNAQSMQMKKAPSYKPPYRVDVWEERDRLIITVYDKNDKEVASWVDDDARQMFEDGFFDSRDLEQSVLKYLEYIKRR